MNTRRTSLARSSSVRRAAYAAPVQACFIHNVITGNGLTSTSLLETLTLSESTLGGQSVRHPDKHTRTFWHVNLGLENAGGELLIYMIKSTRTHNSLVCVQERLLHAKEPCGLGP